MLIICSLNYLFVSFMLKFFWRTMLGKRSRLRKCSLECTLAETAMSSRYFFCSVGVGYFGPFSCQELLKLLFSPEQA